MDNIFVNAEDRTRPTVFTKMFGDYAKLEKIKVALKKYTTYY
jgi:hypothetical protein